MKFRSYEQHQKTFLTQSIDDILPKNRKAIFIIIYLLLTLVVQGQTKTEITDLTRPDLITNVSRKEIIKADKKNLLDKDFFKSEDSITTKYWKDHYWFYYRVIQKNEDGNPCHDLFALNKEKNKLKRITNFCSGWGSISDFYTGINFLNDQMFILSGRETEEPMGESGLQLIDGDSLKLGKYIPVRESMWYNKKFVRDQKLHIVVQPMERHINHLYYIFFWVPRGRPGKYDYEKAGNQWLYVFDRDFNLVEKKELNEPK